MDLRDAYRVLEVREGAGEDVVREARKTLSKVWHPDRYVNDPSLRDKAEVKLREINEAFEVVRAAGFPASVAPKPSPEPPPKPAPAPEPRIELVPRRRVRTPVVLGMLVAVGVGTYFAIVKLGTRDASDPVRPDAAPHVVTVPEPTPVEPPAGTTFTLGASKDQVIALLGDPNGTSTTGSSETATDNGRTVTRSASTTKLTYGHSEVDLADDRVVGWWDNDVRLHVRIVPADAAVAAAARTRGTLAIGQTSDDVLGVLGTPPRVANHRWSYGTSAIDFDAAGRIVAFVRGDVDLHAGG
jgi:hypothetical protein